MELSPSLLSSLQKLSLFKDFSPSQLKSLFRLCQQEIYVPGDVLCKAGAESDKMYILLSGEVRILTSRKAPLGEETAVTTIGEVGMLTGESRSASVVAESPVMTLAIGRRPLLLLMQQDFSLALRLFRNVLVMVRQKLINADQRIEEML